MQLLGLKVGWADLHDNDEAQGHGGQGGGGGGGAVMAPATVKFLPDGIFTFNVFSPSFCPAINLGCHLSIHPEIHLFPRKWTTESSY